MNVYLFSFSKRENSTKQPTLSSSKKVNCYLKARSTTTQANLEFQTIENPTSYNYVYIPDFKTYYYIQDWAYEKNIWTASCVNDVLATYKSNIGSSELYVLRSSSSYDTDLIDNFYPIKPSHELKRVDTTLTQWKQNIDEGDIVIRLWSGAKEWNKLNSIVMTSTQFSHFMEALFPRQGSNTDPVSFIKPGNYIYQAIGDGINSLIWDPLQYIQSITWYPFTIRAGSMKYYTMFGAWAARWYNHDSTYQQYAPKSDGSGSADTSNLIRGVGEYFCTHYELPNPVKTWNAQINIPTRSTATHRGKWTEQEPFAEYYLYNKFWGVIKLDSNLIAYSMGALNIELSVDLITGMATLNGSVIDRTGAHSNLIFTRSQKVGVDISIDGSQLKKDNQSVVSGVAGGVSSVVSGNYPGLAGDTLGLIGSFYHNGGPATVSNIAESTFANLDNVFKVYGIFYDIAEEDIALNGRPLRKKKKINTLSGYVLVQNGDVPIPGTRDEQAKIKAYLEGGFYYE